MGLPDPVNDTREELTSGILPMICGFLAREKSCSVVDLGVASTGNRMLFARTGARVYVDTSRNALRERIAEHGELDTRDIDDLIATCPDEVDILLFWDMLDYMSLEAIQRIAQRYSEVMRAGGLLYAMTSRQRFIPTAPAVIDVISEERVRFNNEYPLEREAPQYAPKDLEARMPGFVLEKLYLMQNGVQEHLFLFQGLDEI